MRIVRIFAVHFILGCALKASRLLLISKKFVQCPEGEMMSEIGILHPGEMGVSVAASAKNSGHRVYWLSPGRSDKTRARAKKHGLIEITTLTDFCRACEIIFSICPPHAAEEVAHLVMKAGFRGWYLDANAIAPQRAIKLGQLLEADHIRFVDGGIIGGPAWRPKETWLYLSGRHAEEIAACFLNGPLETKILGNEPGKASALKMCYAAYSKGTTALLTAILAVSDSLGIREELGQHWDMDDPGFSEKVNQRVRRVTAKAWRFEGEMREIAATFAGAGLPNEFHQAAAEVYHRIAAFKDSEEIPSLSEVLQALLSP